MNKKMMFLFAVSSIMLASIFAVLDVNAYTYYHGATSTWEDGDAFAWGDGQAQVNGGYMLATTLTYGYAGCYTNSDEVTAIADVDSITVTLWWVNCWIDGCPPNYAVNVTLYVEGDYQDSKPAPLYQSQDGFLQVTFNNLDVDSGDDLDVDVCFEAFFYSWVEATFTYVAFTTD